MKAAIAVDKLRCIRATLAHDCHAVRQMVEHHGVNRARFTSEERRLGRRPGKIEAMEKEAR